MKSFIKNRIQRNFEFWISSMIPFKSRSPSNQIKVMIVISLYVH